MINRKVFDEFGSIYEGKADVLRYEVLCRFGGGQTSRTHKSRLVAECRGFEKLEIAASESKAGLDFNVAGQYPITGRYVNRNPISVVTPFG